jgi:drug/metabolite transporter (DMT)-like permease
MPRISSAESSLDWAATQGGVTPKTPRIVYLYLAIIVVTWAANWPLMKLALGEMPPFLFVLYRLVGSLAVLAPALVARGIPLAPVKGERVGLLWVGLLQVGGFLICGIFGLALVPAGRAIVLAYTMPLWAIPIGLWLWPEPLGRFQLAGAAIGFAGLIVFMNPGLVDWGSWHTLIGNGLLVLSAICWALGSCLYRQRKWRSPLWTQTFWQLAVSTIAVVALLPSVAPGSARWSLGAVAILAYNWVISTALGYFLWSRVLTMMAAATAGQVVALTPVGGFLLSTIIFGGAVDGQIAVSIVLIVAGILLTLRR